jgi:hypothetical protein
MKLFPLASYRKWLLGVAVLAGVALFLLDKILRNTTCPASFDAGCENYTDILFAFDAGYFIKTILVVSLSLLFFPERAFKWWRWFAIISIPLLAWWMIPPGGDFFGRQAVDKVSALFFIVGSILIALAAIIYNHLKFRGKK